jgi:hypothetical protein
VRVHDHRAAARNERPLPGRLVRRLPFISKRAQEGRSDANEAQKETLRGERVLAGLGHRKGGRGNKAEGSGARRIARNNRDRTGYVPLDERAQPDPYAEKLEGIRRVARCRAVVPSWQKGSRRFPPPRRFSPPPRRRPGRVEARRSKRHTRTAAEASSIGLSIPNAISVRLPAVYAGTACQDAPPAPQDVACSRLRSTWRRHGPCSSARWPGPQAASGPSESWVPAAKLTAFAVRAVNGAEVRGLQANPPAVGLHRGRITHRSSTTPRGPQPRGSVGLRLTQGHRTSGEATG